MISKVISVCCQRDQATWQVASKYVIKNILAAAYELVVPDAEVALFKAISPENFQVVGESKYLGSRDLSWLRSKISPGFEQRAGWYLQQFIKIEAARQGSPSDINLIWDADTVPIRKLDFVTEDGKLVYYHSDEFHEPYFALIHKLLKLEKIVDFCFIAQSFPVKVAWVNSFCNAIENNFEAHWIDAIVDNIEFRQVSGFSEYETLGTYFSHNYIAEMRLNHSPWQRMGNSQLGGISLVAGDIDTENLPKYDFVSFEAWDMDVRKTQLLN